MMIREGGLDARPHPELLNSFVVPAQVFVVSRLEGIPQAELKAPAAVVHRARRRAEVGVDVSAASGMLPS
jgi:hypothetical protein